MLERAFTGCFLPHCLIFNYDHFSCVPYAYNNKKVRLTGM